MGLWDLVSNIVLGGAQVTVNAAKLVVSPIVAPFDDGKAMEDSADGIAESLEKIGKADDD